jgi:hypothetical protein
MEHMHVLSLSACIVTHTIGRTWFTGQVGLQLSELLMILVYSVTVWDDSLGGLRRVQTFQSTSL